MDWRNAAGSRICRPEACARRRCPSGLSSLVRSSKSRSHVTKNSALETICRIQVRFVVAVTLIPEFGRDVLHRCCQGRDPAEECRNPVGGELRNLLWIFVRFRTSSISRRIASLITNSMRSASAAASAPAAGPRLEIAACRNTTQLKTALGLLARMRRVATFPPCGIQLFGHKLFQGVFSCPLTRGVDGRENFSERHS